MYLLDTHALVWAVTEPETLPLRIRNLTASDELLKGSVISYWELILKQGKAQALVDDAVHWWHTVIVKSGIEILPVQTRHVDRLAELQPHHRDPFDRMLVAQAIAEGLTIISKDSALGRYGVPVVWD